MAQASGGEPGRRNEGEGSVSQGAREGPVSQGARERSESKITSSGGGGGAIGTLNSYVSSIVIGIILLISLILLISSWSLLKTKTALAHELLGSATFTLVIVFLLEIKWPSQQIRKAVAVVSALIAISSIVIGSLETGRPRSTPKDASIRRLPINCTIYALTILGVTVFRLMSSETQDPDRNEIIKDRLKTSAVSLTGLIVIFSVLIAIGIRYKQYASVLEVYWKESLAVAVAFIFVLAYNWVGDAFKNSFNDTAPSGRKAIRNFIHDIIYPIKIACVFILIIMTLVNNAGRFQKHPKSVGIAGGIGFVVSFVGLISSYHEQIQKTPIKLIDILVCSIIIGALTASIPTTPFIRDNGGVVGGMIALVAVTSVLFMLALTYAVKDTHSWKDVLRSNRWNIVCVAVVSIILYLLLQSSGLLEDSLDLVTEEHVKQQSEASLSKEKTVTDEISPEISPEIEELHVYESDVWSQVYLAAGTLGVIVLVLVLLYVMSASIGLVTSNQIESQKFLPVPSKHLWWLAILFSVLMNIAYLYLYVFTKKWAHRLNKIEETDDENQVFGIEFVFVLIKFVLFFYVLVAIGLIYVQTPEKIQTSNVLRTDDVSL